MRPITRRQFLAHSAATAAAFACAGSVSVPAAPVPREPWFKISLAEWSLHRALFSKKINNLDFPRIAREEYGIEACEYVNQFFKDKAKDDSYLNELNKRARDHGIRNVLIMVDDEGILGHEIPKLRLRAVENHYKWIEAAKKLGCHGARVNAYAMGSYDQQQKRVADGLHRLAEFAQGLKMNLMVENHGGLSSNGDWLTEVIKMVNMPNFGTLPDFGNFNLDKDSRYDRYKGVGAMLPYAKGVSAKSHDFDAAGNETHTDYRRMMRMVKDSGYRGYVGVEYEGPKTSEPDGIRLTKALLEKVREELS
jgi:sugar phosphate isomerase/epimerase